MKISSKQWKLIHLFDFDIDNLNDANGTNGKFWKNQLTN